MRLIRVTNLYAVITAVWAIGAHRALPDLVVESAPRLIARTLRAAIVAAFVFRLSDIDNHPQNLGCGCCNVCPSTITRAIPITEVIVRFHGCAQCGRSEERRVGK